MLLFLLAPFQIDRISVPFLSETNWAGNSLLEWLIAAGVFLGVALLVRVTVAIVTRRLRKLAQGTATKADDAWVKVLASTAWFSYFALALSIARNLVTLEPGTNRLLSALTFALLGIQVALWAQAVLGVLLDSWTAKQENASSTTAAAATRFIARLAIWSLLALVVLSNLGIELTTVVAGLGVGGIAAALAVQSLLGDLFAGLSMYFDRPFDIGEFIIVGDVMGNVTKIGLRTTRIDSLGGEKIVYPNGELTKNFIRNYARMKERRIVFAFGIEYGVSPGQINAAQAIAAEVVQAQSEVRFDRAHFKTYGAYSLDYEVVYYVLSPDYNLYMDKQHAINVGLYERFAEANIPFAFPTQTIYSRSETKPDDDGQADSEHAPRPVG